MAGMFMFMSDLLVLVVDSVVRAWQDRCCRGNMPLASFITKAPHHSTLVTQTEQRQSNRTSIEYS